MISKSKKDKHQLTAKQKSAIKELLKCETIAEVASNIGVTETKLHTWLCDPFFISIFHKHRRMAFDQAISQLQINVSVAVATLKAIMTDTAVTASSRVSAATNIINIGMKFSETDNWVSRIDDIENNIEKLSGFSEDDEFYDYDDSYLNEYIYVNADNAVGKVPPPGE